MPLLLEMGRCMAWRLAEDYACRCPKWQHGHMSVIGMIIIHLDYFCGLSSNERSPVPRRVEWSVLHRTVNGLQNRNLLALGLCTLRGCKVFAPLSHAIVHNQKEW